MTFAPKKEGAASITVSVKPSKGATVESSKVETTDEVSAESGGVSFDVPFTISKKLKQGDVLIQLTIEATDSNGKKSKTKAIVPILVGL